jgi:hypothetical protein
MPPKHLQPLAVIEEVRRLRQEVEQRVARIFELSDTFYNSVRRGDFRLERNRIEADLQLLQTRLDQAVRRGESSDARRTLQAAIDGADQRLKDHEEIVPVYLAFANSWKRFAGSMHQGLLRTASVDRVVDMVHRKQGTMDEPEQKAREPRAEEPLVDDLVELYGDGVEDD